MNISKETIVGELVAEDYKAASVFKSYEIDFCCKGNRSINEVCESNNINSQSLIDDLDTTLNKAESGSTDYKSWPIDLLVDYIEKRHHKYVDDKILEIKPYLDKTCNAHGKDNPELLEIRELFNQSAGELTAHMKKEELILFPFVRQVAKVILTGEKLDAAHFGSVENPVNMMKEEHVDEGERFRKISELSNNYTIPEGGCNTYAVTYALLKEFEEDLHLHIHLENNILFPKAIELEKQFVNS